MALTYSPIATTTLSSAQNSVTFSSISGTYTDLVVVWNGATASSNNVSLRFNSDTGNNYSATRMRGTSSGAGSTRWSNIDMAYGPNPDTTGTSTVIWQIQNYSNSTTYKTAIAKGGGAAGEAGAYVGLWRNTSAITSVTVIINASVNMNSGTVVSLYGIAAA